MDDDEHKVYDPHDEQPVVRPNLGEAYESEQERMLHAKQPPRDIVKHALRNAEDQGATTSATPSDAVSHTGGGAPASNIPGDLLGRESDSLYNPVQDQPKGAGLRKFLGKAKTGAKKHKKKIWIAAGGVGGIFVLFMLLLFLLGSLLIPHFFQNMLAYRFANSARSFRQANEQILSREMADQAASDSRWDQIKSKYQNVKSFATLAKYRPAAIVRNLKATGALDFVYEPRSNAAATLLRGPRMTAIKINGQEIPLTAKSKLGIPFSAASDNIRLSASIDQALATSWKGPQGPLAILRTATGAKILQDIGWNGFYAWANKAKNYRNLDAKEADRAQLADEHSRVSTPPTEESLVKSVTDGANQTKDAVAECYKVSSCLDQIIQDNGGTPSSVLNAIDKAVNVNVIQTVTGALSTTYAVAVPACMILDGSISNAGPIIDARAASVEKEFMYFGAAANQQEAGDTAASAVAAFNRKFNDNGDAARSNIQQLSQGGSPSTIENTLPPQSSALGDLTILDAIFRTKGNPLDGPLTSNCKTLTDWRFGVAEVAVELALGFFTGGGSEAAERAGAETVKVAVVAYLKDFAKSLATKKTLSKLVLQGGGTAGATFLARMLVNSYAGNIEGTGQAMGLDGMNETDAGGSLVAQEEDRVMGGAPMTSADVANSHAADRADNAQQQQSLGFVQRYLAVDNAQSLLSRVGDTILLNANHSRIASMLSSAASHIFNPFAALGLMGKLSPSVSAAGVSDTSDYGNTVWGMTEAETNFVNNNSSFYDTYENDYQLQQSGKEQDIQDKYGKCYDESQGTLIAEGDIVKDANGNVIADQGLCSPDNLGMNNNEFGDKMVFRWRLSKRIQAVGGTANEFGDPSLDQ